MNFPAQTLTTAAHDDVGKITIPNVTFDGSFTNAQNFCGFLDCEQPLVIVGSNWYFHYSPKKAHTIADGWQRSSLAH
jgi:hypothetical protein